MHSLHKPIWTSLFQWLYTVGKHTGNELLVRVSYSFSSFSHPACLSENGVTGGNLISGYVRGICNITPWLKLLRVNFLNTLVVTYKANCSRETENERKKNLTGIWGCQCIPWEMKKTEGTMGDEEKRG